MKTADPERVSCDQAHFSGRTIVLPLAIVSDTAMIDRRLGPLWLRTYRKFSTMFLNLDLDRRVSRSRRGWA
ncbi:MULTISPECIES: hypothetical protein [Bradyrhizobium]|uniref:Uncharacterized protein n=1 Tax=Bradyrhizobium arachidis TaxID=858423 RepID=A0AAE7NK05_9BRAD|nr:MULTISPECIES: hypothetical protein [Bradyrhizobium]MDA9447892.1 hypothetical protein [Bradyrhizobium sp. CCBAU 21360]QOZ66717.1 hypothetical protein WN72_10550 [Bradyrhizobium arachidis]SFV14752.1 hypothetical protein SAMN05192541_12226 [Bradyrhizobium arachidis]